MAKINTAGIAGYDTMTAEEKLAALEGFEIPDPDYTGWIRKDTFDKTAHDLAEMKKQLRAQMSAEEQKKQADAEALAALQNELAELRKDKTVSEYKAKYIAQGYSEALAADTALALANGDAEKVFANGQTFLAEYAKTVKADAMKGTPRPAAGGASVGMTLEQLKKLSDIEYTKFAAEHPDEYKSLYQKGE